MFLCVHALTLSMSSLLMQLGRSLRKDSSNNLLLGATLVSSSTVAGVVGFSGVLLFMVMYGSLWWCVVVCGGVW